MQADRPGRRASSAHLRLARALHAEGVHGAGEQDPHPRAQAPPDRDRRGLPRGLARPQVARRAVRVVPEGRALLAGADELRQTLMRLLDLQERKNIQLFVRPDLARGQGLGARRAAARSLQRRAPPSPPGLFLQERFGGSIVDYHLSLGEADQALIHFAVHVDGEIPEVSFTELEQEVVALARTWDDRLRERLAALHGEERGNAARRRVRAALPRLLQVLDRHLPGGARHRAVRAARRAASRSSSDCRTSARRVRA